MSQSIGSLLNAHRHCPVKAPCITSRLLSSHAAAPRTSLPGRRKFCRAAIGNGQVNGTTIAAPKGSAAELEQAYLSMRTKHVTDQFPGALGVDDYLSRVEIALFELGFDGANSIAMTNLCRDEVTAVLKTKIEEVFGASFNTNGLGGVLTCGVIGVKAGLSHSPQCKAGRDRYVFFSFPHIAIDSRGTVGNISRPGRPGPSAACGALKGALGLLANGISANESEPGVHDASDPEFSIFKQRLINRLKTEGVSEDAAKKMDLVELTKVAERAITADLEALISKAVDSSTADYAVVTGVQIHNWSDADFNDQQPTMEFIYPSTFYAFVNGQPKSINLTGFPGLTPRQINILAAGSGAAAAGPHADFEPVCGVTADKTTVRAVDVPYSHNDRSMRAGTSRNAEFYEAELTGRKRKKRTRRVSA